MNLANTNTQVIAALAAIAVLTFFLAPYIGPIMRYNWSERRLERFLDRHSVNWKAWGPDFGSCTIKCLVGALRRGEVSLESRGRGKPPSLCKYIAVVSVVCKRDHKWYELREYRETGLTGQFRERPFENGSLGVRVQTRYETYEYAAMRGTKKKLKIIEPTDFMFHEGPSSTICPGNSTSHPGMVDVMHERRYVIWLPKKSRRYETHYEFTDPESGIKSYFRWTEMKEAPSLSPENEEQRVPELTQKVFDQEQVAS